MGAVNYCTSDYITLGIRPYDRIDFENDSAFMQEIKAEVSEYGGTVDEAIDTYIDGCYESDLANIEYELEKHHFQYYHIAIKPGYYEGFTLDIENNYGVAYDSWEDRRQAQKEITEIKSFLLTCAGMGLVKCSPGWVPGYSTYPETVKAINEAIKEMRREAKSIPTWAQYERREIYGKQAM